MCRGYVIISSKTFSTVDWISQCYWQRKTRRYGMHFISSAGRDTIYKFSQVRCCFLFIMPIWVDKGISKKFFPNRLVLKDVLLNYFWQNKFFHARPPVWIAYCSQHCEIWSLFTENDWLAITRRCTCTLFSLAGRGCKLPCLQLVLMRSQQDLNFSQPQTVMWKVVDWCKFCKRTLIEHSHFIRSGSFYLKIGRIYTCFFAISNCEILLSCVIWCEN